MRLDQPTSSRLNLVRVCFNLKLYMDTNKEQEIIEYLLNIDPSHPVLRKLMTSEEIHIANKLVKQGKLHKGMSDSNISTVCYYSDKQI